MAAPKIPFARRKNRSWCLYYTCMLARSHELLSSIATKQDNQNNLCLNGGTISNELKIWLDQGSSLRNMNWPIVRVEAWCNPTTGPKPKRHTCLYQKQAGTVPRAAMPVGHRGHPNTIRNNSCSKMCYTCTRYTLPEANHGKRHWLHRTESLLLKI